MFHSQLYRSIRQVCREFPSYSYYAVTISLPLLVSIPTAYGAVVDTKVATNQVNSNLLGKHSSDSSSLDSNLSDKSHTSKRRIMPKHAELFMAYNIAHAYKSEDLLGSIDLISSVNKTNHKVPFSGRQASPHQIPASESSHAISNRTANADADNNSVTEKPSESSELKGSELKSSDLLYQTPSITLAQDFSKISNDSNTLYKGDLYGDDWLKGDWHKNELDKDGLPKSHSNLSVLDNETTNKTVNNPSKTVNNKVTASDTALKVDTINLSSGTTNDTIIGTDTNGTNTDGTNIDDNANITNRKITDASEITETNQPSNPIKERLQEARRLATDLDDDSVQNSLERLAEFYQLSSDDITDPRTDDLSPANPSIISPSTNSPVIDTNSSAPLVAPKIYNSQQASSQRCEGVWVTPKTTDNDSRYSQAIRNAQQNDGLDISNGLPLYTQADYAYYDNISYLELSGNVELVQNGQLINAEQVVLDLDTGIANVKGDVLLADSMLNSAVKPSTSSMLSTSSTLEDKAQDSGVIIAAKELAYDTNSSATTAHNVAFASVAMQAHGYAEKLNRPDETHLELEKVMFSTCPPTDRKWQLEAQNIDIDSETGRGKSYNTTFRLGNIPVLYLPYFEFPIDDRRSSGVLTPSASLDSENGLQVSIPYYLNLAPNYDATVTTDVYTNRNPMLTTELRYLTDKYGQGDIKATYLPSDTQYKGKNRRALFYNHSWEPEAFPNLSANVVYNYVSDAKYLDDFDDFGTTDSHLNLPRRAQVNYYNVYLTTQFKVETFQSLDAVDADGNPVQDKDKPYSRLPQLSATYRLPQINNVLVTGVHDSAYFKKSITDGSENEKSGVRIYNKLSASYPLERSWGHITPTVNLHHLFTAYDEESRLVNNVSTQDNTKMAFVPEFSLESALNFYQAGSPLGLFDDSLGGYQLLSPRLKYTYAKYRNQNDIPNFDTRTASIDYDQLFSDSRFLGYDRIPDNNNVTLGVDYRYIDAMGVTRFDGSIGDQFYLDDIKVTLDPNDNPYNVDSSGVAWRSSVQPYRNLWFDFSGALNSDYDVNYIASQVRYQPTPLSLINLGVIERKEDKLTNQSALSALTASTIIPFNDNWRFMAQSQYDNRNNKFIDSTIGLGYEDCCYGFSVYGRSYYNDLNFDDKPTQAIMFEFRINGLGDSDSRFSKLLSNKILGFEPVDRLWNK